jgi:phosphoserine phosphatase
LSQPDATKIQELEQQLSILRLERDKLNSEAKAWAEKRNAVHEQVKTLRGEAKQLKEKRDSINQKVKEQKTLREQARNLQREKRAQVSKAKEKLQGMMEKTPSRRVADIQKEIDRIDWTIQTTSIPVSEEKALVDKVRVLESQRAALKQWLELKNTLVELKTEEKALATQAKQHHETLTQLVEQGQECHKRMFELVSEAQSLRSEADAAHQKNMEFRQKANEIHQRFLQTLQLINSVKQEAQKKEEAKQTEKTEKLREEAVQKAQEKMKRGEKMTWEEFKLLTETTEGEEGEEE